MGYAYAVIRSEVPKVIAAEDLAVLQWVLAIKVVAQQRPEFLSGERRDQLRQALLDERWGDAVAGWIEVTGTPVDVYDDLEVISREAISEETAGLELQFTPLFKED